MTWYEAFAFSQWLDEVLHKIGLPILEIDYEWQVRLPSESEWEKAARYPDNHAFPWGDEYIPGYANIDEVFENAECGLYSLRRTTAVGIYPEGATPTGVHDLIGNVFEWCLSKWTRKYIYPEDNDPDGIDFRVIKGGSWFNPVIFAQALKRDHLDADLAVNDIGFRVVAGIRKINGSG